MMPSINDEITKLPLLGQRQDGTSDQLSDLLHFLRKAGMQEAVATIVGTDPLTREEKAMSEYLSEAYNVITENVGADLDADAQNLTAYNLANRLGLYDAADLVRNVQVRRKKMAR